MNKNIILKEKKKLETQKEKLQQSIESMQIELSNVVDTLKKTNAILAQYEKAEADAAILFGKVLDSKIDG